MIEVYRRYFYYTSEILSYTTPLGERFAGFPSEIRMTVEYSKDQLMFVATYECLKKTPEEFAIICHMYSNYPIVGSELPDQIGDLKLTSVSVMV